MMQIVRAPNCCAIANVPGTNVPRRSFLARSYCDDSALSAAGRYAHRARLPIEGQRARKPHTVASRDTPTGRVPSEVRWRRRPRCLSSNGKADQGHAVRIPACREDYDEIALWGKKPFGFSTTFLSVPRRDTLR